MILRSIRIENLKCIKKAEVSGLQNINLFFGKNNAGKSTIMSALRQLSQQSGIAPLQSHRELGIPALWNQQRNIEAPYQPTCIEVTVELEEDLRRRCIADIYPDPEPERLANILASDFGERITCRFEKAGRQTNYQPAELSSGKILLMRKHDNIWCWLNIQDIIQGNIDFRSYHVSEIVEGKNFEENVPISRAPAYCFLSEIYEFFKNGFYLDPWRHSIPKQAAQETNALMPDASNLANRVHTFANNEPISFQNLLNIAAGMIEDLGTISSPIIGNEVSIRSNYTDDETIQLSEQGAGLEQLLTFLMSFVGEKGTSLLGLEEPENHLHPGALLKLFEHMAENAGNRQIFVCTHSPVLVGSDLPDCSTYRVQRTPDHGTEVSKVERDARWAVMYDLGVSPSTFMQPDAILYVEGPNDVAATRKMLAKFEESHPELVNADIAILTLHGNSAIGRKDFPFEAIAKIHPKTVFLIDSDRENAETPLCSQKVRFKEGAAEAGLYCHITNGREFENYFSWEAIKQVFPSVPEVDLAPYSLLSIPKDRNGEFAAATSMEHLQKTDFPELVEHICMLLERGN